MFTTISWLAESSPSETVTFNSYEDFVSKSGVVLNVSTPDSASSSNSSPSAPLSIEKVRLSASISVAVNAPTLDWFSSALKLELDVNSGASFSSVTVTVTSWVSVRPAASVTVTVAVIASVVVSKSGADTKLNTPVSASMVNTSPETAKVKVSLASWSEAVIVPSSIVVWFSAALNAVVVEVIVGASFISLTLIASSCVASLTPSLAVTIASKEALVSKSGAVVNIISPVEASIDNTAASVPLIL